MVGLQKVLIRLQADLEELHQRWALVGGLAVSARSEPRTTRDLDVAVVVETDREAERLIADLHALEACCTAGAAAVAQVEDEVRARRLTGVLTGFSAARKPAASWSRCCWAARE